MIIKEYIHELKITDQEREKRIRLALDLVIEYAQRGDRKKAEFHNNEAIRLINERSPKQIKRMERKLGFLTKKPCVRNMAKKVSSK